MLRTVLVAFCLLSAACTATGTIVSDDPDNQKDLSSADVEDDLFLSTIEGVNDINPFDFASTKSHCLGHVLWRRE